MSDNGACRDGYTPSGWCNVKVDNLFSLELLKRSNVSDTPDLSLVHNNPICMDANVAKNLFNTTCLAEPIVTLMISKTLIVNDAILAVIVLILIALIALLCYEDEKEGTGTNECSTLEGSIKHHDKTVRQHYPPLIIQPCDVINA